MKRGRMPAASIVSTTSMPMSPPPMTTGWRGRRAAAIACSLAVP
jgi:hypothetical protein